MQTWLQVQQNDNKKYKTFSGSLTDITVITHESKLLQPVTDRIFP